MLRSRRTIAAVTLIALTGVSMWLYNTTQRANVDRSLQEYTAHRLEGDLRIDGHLNEKEWNRANVTAPFIRSDGETHGPLPCTARLLWDDTYLYIGFEVVDNDIQSPHRERDADLFTQDVVELFLDPDGDGRNYYEFEISPRAVLFDALFPSYRHNLPLSRRWNAPGFRAATVLDGIPDDSKRDHGWSAEIQIPWRALRYAPHSPPRVGDRWRMNLFRIDAHTRSADYTAWTAPLVGDFHKLDRFGTLVFGP